MEAWMKIYWTLKSIPELSHLTFQERGKRWRSAYKLIFRHWQTWCGLLICGLCVGAGTSYYGTPGLIISGGLGGFIYGNIAVYVARRYYRDKFIR